MAKLTVTAQNFSQKLATFATTMKRMKSQSHELAVFSLNHAQQHGDCIYLNALWEKLTPAMQAAFRRYVVACTAEDMADLNSSWLTMIQKNWAINPEFKGKARKSYFRKKGEKTVELKTASELIDKDTFHEIDPDKVKNPFSDDNVVQTIHRLVRSSEKDDAKVSDEMKDILASFEKQVNKFVAKKEDAPALPAQTTRNTEHRPAAAA